MRFAGQDVGGGQRRIRELDWRDQAEFAGRHSDLDSPVV